MPTATATPLEPGTRELLIVTAERLFAEQGIDRVSLRQIGEAAGRRQPSAVQYHFGDAHGLVRAIVAFRTAAANERRTVMLDDLVLAGRAGDVPALLEAVAFPLLETLPADSHYLGFVAELLARKRIAPIFAEPGTEYGENAQRIARYLDGALRWVPTALRRRRIERALDTLLTSLARDWEPADRRRAAVRAGAAASDLMVADVLACAAAMLTAPVPSVSVPESSSHRKRLR
ncbi:MAG: helix-turn-helix domain-containing protein [Acidimicrobiia bacterium]